MPPLSHPDQGAFILLVLVIAWALTEHLVLCRNVPSTIEGQLRRRWGASILLIGLGIAYGGRLFGMTPWISRPLVGAGIAMLALGYYRDRKVHRQGAS